MGILVVDCGSSSCRGTVYDTSQSVKVAETRVALPTISTSGSAAVVDIPRVWRTVCSVIQTLVETVPPAKIDVVGITSVFGYAFLGADGQPLIEATSWKDRRAAAHAAWFERRLGRNEIHRVCGRRTSPDHLAPLLLYLRKSAPGLFQKIHTICGTKDALLQLLTGRVGTDYAHRDYSLLFEVGTGAPFEDAWSLLAPLTPEVFAETAAADAGAGTVCAEAARATGLVQGTPVIRGSSDGTASMYGAGVGQKGMAVLVSGTSDVIMVGGDIRAKDPNAVLSINTAMDGGYLSGGATALSGGALAATASLLRVPIEHVEEMVRSVPPGCEGLTVVPALAGERSPFWAPGAEGLVSGWNEGHTPGHFLRACMEGATFRAAELLQRVREGGVSVRELRIGGGGSQSEVWNQMRADMTALPTAMVSDPESTSRGMALFGLAHLRGSLTTVLSDAAGTDRATSYSPSKQGVAAYRQTRNRMASAFALACARREQLSGSVGI